MKIHIFFSLILLLFFIECNNQYTNTESFRLLMHDFPDTTKGKLIYIVVPSTTCSVCNNYLDDKLADFLKMEYPIQVIYECQPFEYYQLYLKLSKKGINGHPKIFIDTLLKYQLPSTDKNSGTTAIIVTEDKSIEEVRFLNTNNPYTLNQIIL